MKKVKMINFNDNGFITLSTSNAIEWESISPPRIWILSNLFNFNPKIHEKSENDQFQWKFVYLIMHVKFHRMKSIGPVRIWILSDLYNFNPKIHEISENDQFQWKWVSMTMHVKCYRMTIHMSCPNMDFKWSIQLLSKNTWNKWKWSISMKVGLSD